MFFGFCTSFIISCLLKYLFAQVIEQNLLVPLNWLAGAKLLQYSHLSTGNEWKKQNNRIRIYFHIEVFCILLY